MLRDHLFGPVVILNCSHDEFDFVSGFQMFEIFEAISFAFAAAGTFQIHDSANPRVDLGDVVRATGFEENSELIVAKVFHQRQRVLLKQGLATSKFNQRSLLLLNVRRGQAINFGLNFGECAFFPFGEGISSIAVRTAQITGGQADKDAWQAGKSAFALQAQVNLVDD